MIKIYMIRHGQTKSNVWNIMQGWSDTPLTEKGINQGRELAEKLKNENVLAIYSSTSERAYDTATFINQYHNLNIELSKGLKEMNFGEMECQREVYHSWLEFFYHDWTEIGGDSLEDLTQRVYKVIQDILDQYMDKQGVIVCVTHCFTILALIKKVCPVVFIKCEKENIKIDNCTINSFLCEDEKFQIEQLNGEFISRISK